jgi:hypothetical protein
MSDAHTDIARSGDGSSGEERGGGERATEESEVTSAAETEAARQVAAANAAAQAQIAATIKALAYDAWTLEMQLKRARELGLPAASVPESRLKSEKQFILALLAQKSIWANAMLVIHMKPGDAPLPLLEWRLQMLAHYAGNMVADKTDTSIPVFPEAAWLGSKLAGMAANPVNSLRTRFIDAAWCFLATEKEHIILEALSVEVGPGVVAEAATHASAAAACNYKHNLLDCGKYLTYMDHPVCYVISRYAMCICMNALGKEHTAWFLRALVTLIRNNCDEDAITETSPPLFITCGKTELIQYRPDGGHGTDKA